MIRSTKRAGMGSTPPTFIACWIKLLRHRQPRELDRSGGRNPHRHAVDTGSKRIVLDHNRHAPRAIRRRCPRADKINVMLYPGVQGG